MWREHRELMELEFRLGVTFEALRGLSQAPQHQPIAWGPGRLAKPDPAEFARTTPLHPGDALESRVHDELISPCSWRSQVPPSLQAGWFGRSLSTALSVLGWSFASLRPSSI